MTTKENVWEVPRPLSIRQVQLDDGAFITLRRHGNPDGQRLVMSHGNGLAIDLYYPFWSLLKDDFDLMVYDLRNHGWNEVGDLAKHTIPTFVRDHDSVLEAIDRCYGEKPKIGVFHSVSALTTLLSPKQGTEYAARVLFDPPLCKPGRSYEEFDAAATRLAKMTRSRTSQFSSTEEMAEILPYFPNFQRVVPGVCNLMARVTLRKNEDEDGYVLRCPSEYEAQIMEYASIFAVLVDFDKYRCPTKVIGADPTLDYSYLPTLDLSDTVSVDYDFLPDATHFLQLEQPAECVETMRDFIGSI